MLLASVLMGFTLYDEYKKRQDASKEKQEKEQESQKILTRKESLHLERSPLGTRNLVVYQLNDKALFENHIMIAMQDANSQKEEPLFVGEERTGMPKWLGNDHIFFTSYCGTACQGIYLINVLNKEVKLATLSFKFSDTNDWETHFSDWFDKKFQFPGLLGEISTESRSNDNFYLVFSKKDQLDNKLSKKRFLFTGQALVEQLNDKGQLWYDDSY